MTDTPAPCTNVVNEERVMRALTFLSSTDKELARSKALLDGLEETKKTVRASAFLKAQGAQGERAEKAHDSAEYREHLKKLGDAVYEYELLKAQRTTEALYVDVWRSLLSARKQGIVV